MSNSRPKGRDHDFRYIYGTSPQQSLPQKRATVSGSVYSATECIMKTIGEGMRTEKLLSIQTLKICNTNLQLLMSMMLMPL